MPVNIDGALAVALTALRLDPVYGAFRFVIARGFGRAAHDVEEQVREARCAPLTQPQRNTTVSHCAVSTHGSQTMKHDTRTKRFEMRTVAEQLVDYLRDRGVNHIFGLCGHTNIAALAALEDTPIQFVNVRHEQVASHAADAYARVTAKQASC